MKMIKYAIFFIKESPKFMGESLIKLIIHKHFFKIMKIYIKNMKTWDKNIKKNGIEATYCYLNRNIEIEI